MLVPSAFCLPTAHCIPGFRRSRKRGKWAALGREAVRMRKLLWWVGVPTAVAAAGAAWVTVFPTRSGAG
jgi:hypothetical protein